MDPIQPEVSQAQGRKNIGPIVAIVVIIILLVIGGLYVWGEKLSIKSSDEAVAPTTTSETQAMMAEETSPTVSNSDEVDALQADLNANSETQIDYSGLESI